SGSNRHFRIARHRQRNEGADPAEAVECRAESAGSEVHDDHASGRAAESGRRPNFAGRNRSGVLRRPARMNAFRYQAVETSGSSVEGVIEAEDRKSALRMLGERGLFPSSLEISNSRNGESVASRGPVTERGIEAPSGGRIRRKDITAFTREM